MEFVARASAPPPVRSRRTGPLRQRGGMIGRRGAAPSTSAAGICLSMPERIGVHIYMTCPLSGMCTSNRARDSSGSVVSVPAVGPSGFSDRYVTA
jgi:hypothetical protein